MQVMQHCSQREGRLFASALRRPVQPFGHSDSDVKMWQNRWVKRVQAANNSLGFFVNPQMLRLLPAPTGWKRQQLHFSRVPNRFTVRETSKYSVQFVRSCHCVVSRFVFSSDWIGQRAFAVAHSPARFSLGELRWRSGRRVWRVSCWRDMIHHFQQVYMQVPSKRPLATSGCQVFNERNQSKRKSDFSAGNSFLYSWIWTQTTEKGNVPGFGARHLTGSFLFVFFSFSLFFFYFLENVTKPSLYVKLYKPFFFCDTENIYKSPSFLSFFLSFFRKEEEKNRQVAVQHKVQLWHSSQWRCV